MSDKRVVHPQLLELAQLCSRLDRYSDEIHSLVRKGNGYCAEPQSLLQDVARAADLCAQVIRNPEHHIPVHAGSILAVSFALRAAHESLDALAAVSGSQAIPPKEPQT